MRIIFILVLIVTLLTIIKIAFSGMLIAIITLFQNTVFVTITIIILSLIILWYIYTLIYFRSKKFRKVKESIKTHIDKCNDLNDHIEDLKNTYINIKPTNYGKAEYLDKSVYNYKRPELKKLREIKNVHRCSLSVCTNAKQQPFKYICKYFNIKTDQKDQNSL